MPAGGMLDHPQQMNGVRLIGYLNQNLPTNLLRLALIALLKLIDCQLKCLFQSRHTGRLHALPYP